MHLTGVMPLAASRRFCFLGGRPTAAWEGLPKGGCGLDLGGSTPTLRALFLIYDTESRRPFPRRQ